MKRFVLTLVFLACSSVVHAQTTTVQALWSTPDAATLAQSYTNTLSRNSAAPVAVTGVTCTVNGTGANCSGSATFTNTTVVTGDSFVLTVKNPASGLSNSSAPAVIGPGPGKPLLTITITVVGP